MPTSPAKLAQQLKLKPGYYFVDDGHEYFKIHKDEQGNPLKTPFESMSGFTHGYETPFMPMENAIRMSYMKAMPDCYDEVKKKTRWNHPTFLAKVQNQVKELFNTKFLPTDEVGSFVANDYYGQDHDVFYKEVIIPAANLLIAEWEEKGLIASEAGTGYHEDREAEDEKRGYVINPFTGLKHTVIKRPKGAVYDNKFILDEILKYKKEHVVLLEATLVDDDTMMMGQLDKLFLQWMGNRFLSYEWDYKTDSKPITNNCIFTENGPETWKKPFMAFRNSRLTLYTMKMNGYAYMLEKLGIKVIAMALEHNRLKKEDEPAKIIHLNLYQGHMALAFKERQEQLEKGIIPDGKINNYISSEEE